jgi:hypothetical protein
MCSLFRPSGDVKNVDTRNEKRGLVQAPFLIDAPKPETESRFGSGHPGKPIFLKLPREEQVLCQPALMENHGSK